MKPFVWRAIPFMKQVPSPMPGFNLLVRLSDESNTAATNVKMNANPHAYIMYKTKRFRSENDLNAFVVLKAKEKEKTTKNNKIKKSIKLLVFQ